MSHTNVTRAPAPEYRARRESIEHSRYSPVWSSCNGCRCSEFPDGNYREKPR